MTRKNQLMDKAKQAAVWGLLIIGAAVFLILAITGRLGILSSIAFVPDNVAYLGS